MSRYYRQVATFVRRLIRAALRKHGSVPAAARALGISSLWLRGRIDELGVRDPVTGEPFGSLASRVVSLSD